MIHSQIQTNRISKQGGYIIARLSLMLMLLLSTLGLNAQTDYSGLYFIVSSKDYDAATPANNFYLYPSLNFYTGTSSHNSTVDNGMPFMTTYKANKNLNSVWLIEKQSNGYYCIIHNATGRYLTVNDPLTSLGSGTAHRKRVHLETVTELTGRNYFIITANGSTFNISCLDAYKSGSNKYLNPAGGNSNTLLPTSNGYSYMIGFYSNANDAGSLWYLEQATEKCATPVIKCSDENVVTITCSTIGTTIYYTTDDTTPTTSSQRYTGPFSIGDNVVRIRAIAVKTGAEDSDEAVYSKTITIHSSTEITDMSGSYRLAEDFTLDSPVGSVSQPFMGTIDGQYHILTGFSQPLLGYANNATVKNVILSEANISGIDVGAICQEATGSTRIYNCGVLSGRISGSGSVGGILGIIAPSSQVRVVNCYNYATIRGGSYAAGIVGRNAGTVGSVRIACCMMYGDIEGGTFISPVYGGNHVSNVKNHTEYNYFRSRASIQYNYLNDQIAIDKDEYLTRFPFFRHILNTHRELASFFLFDDYNAFNVEEVGHWVLNTETAPYPIIEKWQTNTRRTTEDIRNNLPSTSADYAGKLLTAMGTGGYLQVTVNVNGRSYQSSLPITDMDTLRYDFTYGKVVLPFANEYEGWTRDYSKICTGWKITSVTGGTTGTLSHYNFADRNCTAKDLYSNSGYIFAQGGNYIVPYDVTAITIEANFANAFYLSDATYDIGYSSTFTEPVGLGGNVPTLYHGQPVYTNIATLIAKLSEADNPHEQAIVLVGNYHFTNTSAFANAAEKGITIMSVDEDNNQEPDYGWYSYNNVARPVIPSMRFDFVPNIPMGMSSHVTGSAYYPGVSIWKTRGWFELTETSLSIMSQCEIDSYNFTASDNGKGNNRWIANSGYFVQIVRSFQGACTKLSYIQIGGNAYVEELYPGNHSEKQFTNSMVPINVTGGEIEECYLTGYRVNGKSSGTDLYFWCAGGRIHKFLGAYMETPSVGANMTAQIDHARIYRFFGGGTSSSARITGNIDVTINNSKVDFYCGGPEFGDMAQGKTVTTHATNTEFGEYYGAGFGGTSVTNVYNGEDNNVGLSEAETVFPLEFSRYTDKRLTINENYGIASSYKFEYIIHSTGQKAVARFYVGYAQFSLATTGSVTNILNNCQVTGSFYGAGCQGKVDGDATSTLTNCSIAGDAFGGGYKAESNEVNVYTTRQPVYSKYIRDMGLFTDFGTVEPEIYTWEQGTSVYADEAQKKLYTDVVMSDLGNVTGKISIHINGGSVRNVFGGGNESKSLSTTDVTLSGNVTVTNNVYGGGNLANVNGSTNISMLGGTVNHDIYGGGALANTGSATVSLTGGTVSHDVYGGGLGQAADDENGIAAVAALVNGNVSVSLNEGVTNNRKGCVVVGQIFGCNNINGTPTGNVTVHVFKTQKAGAGNITDKTLGTYDVTAVYGGGNQAAYTPTTPWDGTSGAKTQVIIDSCSLSSIGYLYGGGNAAPVPETNLTVNGCYEIGTVFGGGNGAGEGNPGANVGIVDAAAYEADSSTGRYGTGKATTLIYGGRIHNIFGGSNTKGNIVGQANVTLDESEECALTLDEVYGFGNEASMDGEGTLTIRCVKSRIPAIYGGARNADVGTDITLNISSGRFDRVFGGNNMGGDINGTITVNIEETGCHPIIIGQLYGGGNQAAYTAPEEQHGPTINIRSFTSIGEVFGGGYGASAVVTGDTYINIDESIGANASNEIDSETGLSLHTGNTITINEGEDDEVVVNIPQHVSGTIGTIEKVFGGGNAANVVGNTYVNIGTETNSAHITGNVYGGGNNANVSGHTNVNIARSTE